MPDALVEEISARSAAAGIEHGRATRTGLDDAVTVVPVSVVKGLELDGVVVVEPARIVSDEVQGLRALYVALTRPTQRLTVVHAADLPAAMRPASGEVVPELAKRGSAPGRVLQHPPVAEPSRTATRAPNRSAERRASSSPPVNGSAVAMITRPGRRSAASSWRPTRSSPVGPPSGTG